MPRCGFVDHCTRHARIFWRGPGEPGERAALWAARQNRKFVMMSDFEMSKDKVLMGVERKSMILSTREENTAYHEAGHALVRP